MSQSVTPNRKSNLPLFLLNKPRPQPPIPPTDDDEPCAARAGLVRRLDKTVKQRTYDLQCVEHKLSFTVKVAVITAVYALVMTVVAVAAIGGGL